MFLAELLERFKERPRPAEIKALREEITSRFDQYLTTISDFMYKKGSYTKYSRAIMKAYRIHPNKLIENLEQISQLYDQVNDVETLGTPISFLMQNLKTLLPTFFFQDEKEQKETKDSMSAFFEDLDLGAVDEATPGIELYPSYILGRWIREKRCLCEVLDNDREIMFSSYCGLFFDMAAKVLNLDIDAKIVMALIQGPNLPEEDIPVNFDDIVKTEMKFWKRILTNILSSSKYYMRDTKLKKIKNVEDMDVGRALKYLNVPEQAYEIFSNEFDIPVSDFYLAEACANIIENILDITEHGFSPEEQAQLEKILKNPPESYV